MKKLLLLLLGVLIALPSLAQDFDFTYTYEGQTITYTVIDEDAKTCKTKIGTYDKAGNTVTGDLILPAHPKDGDTEYTLIEISTCSFFKCTELNSLFIPNTVETISEAAIRDCSNLASITIPNSVTSIGSTAIANCVALKEIAIPNSVKDIGLQAFYGCSSLTSIFIPSSVELIGSSAFKRCSSLTSLTIEDGEKSLVISDRAFDEAPITFLYMGRTFSGSAPSTVESVEFGDQVKKIGDKSFSNCSSLTSIEIPNSITEIGKEAFAYCSSLTSIVIPSSVKTIGNFAFEGCSSLKIADFASIEALCNIDFGGWYSNPMYMTNSLYINDVEVTDLIIPETVSTIKEYTFRYCNSLTSVIIPPSVANIADNAFNGCSGLVKSAYPNTLKKPFKNGVCISYSASDAVIEDNFIYSADKTSLYFVPWNVEDNYSIPATVDSIGNNAFQGCTALTTIEIGNSVKTIGNNAFQGCTALTTIEIGNSVKTIGGNAFQDCSGLTSAVIGNSVETIGNDAFEGCDNMTSLTIEDGETPITFGWRLGTPIDTLYMGRNWTYNGGSALSTQLKTVKLGNMVTTLPNYAFDKCSVLTSIVIPNSVKSIGDYAFRDCSGLTLVVIPNSVETIGNAAFNGCSGLSSVVIGNSVKSIGDNVFKNCSGLLKSTYPNTISNPFGHFILNQFISYGASLCYPADGALIDDGFVYGPNKNVIYFAPPSYEGEYVIPSSVENIATGTFYLCSGLTSVEIPNSVKSIGEWAFEKCTCLTAIEIPNSVISIGSEAFKSCTGLTAVEIPNSVTSIGESAFENSGLSKFTILDGDTPVAIGAQALSCNIDSLYIGRDWTYPANTEFANDNLKSVEFGSMVTNINEKAFEKCSTLSSVKAPWQKPVSINANVFASQAYSNATLDIPDNTILDYLAHTATWGKFSNLTIDGTETKEFSDNVFKYRIIDNAEHDAVLIPGNYSSMTEANIPERFTDNTDEANPVRYYVKAIGPDAFKGCTKLENVFFNSRSCLTTIGASAFKGCTALTSVTMPTELTAINAAAFEGCTALSDVILNDKLETLGRRAFAGCTGLTAFTMSKEMTEIGPDAFGDCSNIAAFTLNDKLTTICDSAFFNCSAMPEIYIPASVREIGPSAFLKCSGLKKAEFASIEDLCKIQFKGNNYSNPLIAAHHLYVDGEEITDLVIPEGIETLKMTFAGCYYLTSVTFPNTLKEIGGLTFQSCYNLTSIELPNSVVSVYGNKTFSGCSGLTSIKLSDNLESLGNRTFDGCTGLTSISIPASVVTVGEEIFSGCSKLESLTLLDGENLLEFGKNTFSGVNLKELYYGRPTDTDQFQNMAKLATVNVANSMTDIYPATFKGCTGLATLHLGSSLTTIGDEAFSGCTSLAEVVVPPLVETIGVSAFADIPGLETIIMGHSVKSIGANAYDGASAKNVYITAQEPPTAPNNTFSSYTGKLWLQDPGDNSVINAYYDAYTCWDRFNGYAMITASKLEAEKTEIMGQPGETIQLTATLYPENVTLKKIFWRSTNPEIATVDENGLVSIHADIREMMQTYSEGGDDDVRSCKIIAETLYADGPVLEVTVYDASTVGIDQIVVDKAERGEIDYSSPYEVYNLNGYKVADSSLDGLDHGFYIVRQGRVAKKVALR